MCSAHLSDQICFCQRVHIDLPFSSLRRLCPRPEQAEAPAGGLRPADARQYLGGESECNVPVRSTSLPPFLWINKKRTQRPHISFKPGSRLFWQFVLCLLLPPSYFFLFVLFGFWLPLRSFCPQPPTKCLFIRRGLIVLPAKCV